MEKENLIEEKRILPKAYKFRLYPNKEQRVFFAKTFGCCRFLYNKMLADRIRIYEENRDKSKEEKSKIKYPQISSYKVDFPFLKEVDSKALAYTGLNLNTAYKNFFNNKSVGFPKFKSKKNNNNSFTTDSGNSNPEKMENAVRFEGKRLKIRKLKSTIKVRGFREIKGIIKQCTISQSPSGKYFASILVFEEINILPKSDNSVGIDLGTKHFAIMSNGEKVENNRYLKKSEEKIKKLQKELSRKTKGGKNRDKNRKKLAKAYEKVANQRKDFLHKLSTRVIRENQSIVIEDLRVKNMQKNHKFAESISDVAWRNFRMMLEYKSKWYGRNLIIAHTYYASSQLCSNCGFQYKEVKTKGLRYWVCPKCGAKHDRDINAGKNLLKLLDEDNLGKTLRSGRPLESGNACFNRDIDQKPPL
jgi:putative transposase